MKRWAAWGCLTAGLGLTEPSSADDASVVRAGLSWKAEASCTDAAGVRRAVDRRLGRSTFVEDAAEVIVRGDVGQDPSGGWMVRIELVDAEGQRLGQRVLQTPDAACKALDDSVALVVALMVDIPKSELAQRKQELARAAEKPPAPAPPPLARRITLPPSPAREPTLSYDARLEVALALGLLPDPAPGLSAGLLVDPEHFWAIDLEAAAYLPQTLEQGDAGVDFFSSYVAALFVCPIRLALGAGALFACAGQRVGAVQAEGRGFAPNRDQTGLLYDVGARLRLTVPLWGPLRFESAVGAEVPLSRLRYFATRPDGSRRVLFRQSAVMGAAQAGVGLFFR